MGSWLMLTVLFKSYKYMLTIIKRHAILSSIIKREVMQMYIVMFDATDVVICSEEHVSNNKKAGMRIFGRALSEEGAQRLVEQCEMIA